MLNVCNILSFDPSFNNFAYVIFDNNYKYIFSGILEYDKKYKTLSDNIEYRTQLYQNKITDLIKNYNITDIFYEQPNGGRSARSYGNYIFVTIIFSYLKLLNKDIRFLLARVKDLKKFAEHYIKSSEKKDILSWMKLRFPEVRWKGVYSYDNHIADACLVYDYLLQFHECF